MTDTITIAGGSGTDSLTVSDTMVLDLSGYGAASPALTSTSLSSISIDDLVSTSITLPSSYNISNGVTGYTWTQPYTPTVNIDNDGLNVKEGGDIKIGNVSLKDFISKMEQRLSILVPDPERLEKFEALKKAYEHYKTMEALCFPEEKDKKNEC